LLLNEAVIHELSKQITK